mgnify:CR=1 FL=1
MRATSACAAVSRAARASCSLPAAVAAAWLVLNGAAAGQTVFHLHFHIIPRWEGEALGRHAGGGMADIDDLKALAASISDMIA